MCLLCDLYLRTTWNLIKRHISPIQNSKILTKPSVSTACGYCVFLHLPLIGIFLLILESPPTAHQTQCSTCVKTGVKIPTKFLRLLLSHGIEQQELTHLPLKCHKHAQAYLRLVPIESTFSSVPQCPLMGGTVCERRLNGRKAEPSQMDYCSSYSHS